jgi:dihydroxy-acid dehydratase
MEDFYYAGGLPAVIRQLESVIDKTALTPTARPCGRTARTRRTGTEVIRSFDKPFKEAAGIAILKGNLAPDGAVIKPSAATPALLKHRGRAVVFENSDDLHKRIDDENLDVDETCVLVLKNCGPKGYPGMAEAGNMPLPPKVLRKGITDMVRVSDARMSGTAYGTVVLHVSPEAAAGGPLALVQNGDFIELDVEARKLHLDVSEEELARRRAQWKSPNCRRRCSAAGSSSTSTTCSRPTRAPTSISWSARADLRAQGQPLNRNDPRPGWPGQGSKLVSRNPAVTDST